MLVKVLTFILITFTQSVLLSEVIEPIDCKKPDEPKILVNEPRKHYFKGGTEVSISESGADEFLEQFVDEFLNEFRKDEIIDRDSYDKYQDIMFGWSRVKFEPINNILNAYNKIESFNNSEDKKELFLRTTKIDADIMYQLDHGVLLGSNRGEFGGELIYISNSQELT